MYCLTDYLLVVSRIEISHERHHPVIINQYELLYTQLDTRPVYHHPCWLLLLLQSSLRIPCHLSHSNDDSIIRSDWSLIPFIPLLRHHHHRRRRVNPFLFESLYF